MKTMLSSFIDVERVSKTYRSARKPDVPAIDEISLSLGEDEFVSLIGPSGCGKTTLLHLVGGLMEPTSGEILVRGDKRSAHASEFGTVFQAPVLFPWRTIRANIELPAEVLGLPKQEYKARSAELLELVGLVGFGDAYPRELSGGMQQRASIARALIHDPPLLLMDEPFGAVDAITRDTLNVELDRIRTAARKAILFVTHSISEAVFLSDRILVMGNRPTYVKEVIDVPLPKPRDKEIMKTSTFTDLVRQVRVSLSA